MAHPDPPATCFGGFHSVRFLGTGSDKASLESNAFRLSEQQKQTEIQTVFISGTVGGHQRAGRQTHRLHQHIHRLWVMTGLPQCSVEWVDWLLSGRQIPWTSASLAPDHCNQKD